MVMVVMVTVHVSYPLYIIDQGQCVILLPQVKELGLFGRNCSCLARDALNMFEVYWSLALPGNWVSVCVSIYPYIRCYCSQEMGYRSSSIDQQR